MKYEKEEQQEFEILINNILTENNKNLVQIEILLKDVEDMKLETNVKISELKELDNYFTDWKKDIQMVQAEIKVIDKIILESQKQHHFFEIEQMLNI